MSEVWRPVPGFEGKYHVSNHGRVKSYANLHVNDFPDGKILTPSLNPNGYPFLRLSPPCEGESRIWDVHQIVAAAFLGYRRNGYEAVIDHIDNNPLNNHVTNLHIVTQRFNATKRKRPGSTSQYAGVSKHGRKWVAAIYYNKKTHQLGRFKTELEAANAYQFEMEKIEALRAITRQPAGEKTEL